MFSLLKSLLFNKKSSSPQRKPRVYLDASAFDPYADCASGGVVTITAHNEADTIYARVQQALQTAAKVVVVDQGSKDGTPYFAAEAGAVVVIQQPD